MTWLETDRLPAGQLELEGPWNFQLRNPSNPAASTYAGVLEFIARGRCCSSPPMGMVAYWIELSSFIDVFLIDDEDPSAQRRRSSALNWCASTEGKIGETASPIDELLGDIRSESSVRPLRLLLQKHILMLPSQTRTSTSQFLHFDARRHD